MTSLITRTTAQCVVGVGARVEKVVRASPTATTTGGKGRLTFVIADAPPSRTSDWLARNLTLPDHWVLRQKTEWFIRPGGPVTRRGSMTTVSMSVNVRGSASSSGFLSPGLWSVPVFSFWCLALQHHSPPQGGQQTATPQATTRGAGNTSITVNLRRPMADKVSAHRGREACERVSVASVC